MAPRKGKSAARRCRAHQDRRTFREIMEAIPFDAVRTRLRAFAEQLSAPEVRSVLEADVLEWQRLTGFPLPTLGAFAESAVRLGVAPETTRAGHCDWDLLWLAARGQHARREDEARAREQAELRALAARRAAEAAPVVIIDDEWTVIANGLSGNQPDVLVSLNADGAFTGVDRLTREWLAESLGLSLPAVAKAVRKLKSMGLVNTAQGHHGGLQITDKGRNVAARIPRSRCRQGSLAMGDGVKGAQTDPSGVVSVRRA